LDVEVNGARCDGGQRTNLFDAVFRHSDNITSERYTVNLFIAEQCLDESRLDGRVSDPAEHLSAIRLCHKPDRSGHTPTVRHVSIERSVIPPFVGLLL
jgi:hypothetical protein